MHTYLDLQQVVATNALVVHLMVGVVSVAAALVLNEGEAGRLALACATGCRHYGTYRRDEAERGAGMSQRTRRPYLEAC